MNLKSPGKIRVLVTIASYGRKNIGYLKQIVQGYRAMDFDVTVVVVSEAPKDLGEQVEVVVGLPSRNPWSLPFAHKEVLARNLERFDLFIYSEDDVEVTEKNIKAFLRITPRLDHSEIAGFMRYETDKSGTQVLTDVHGPFRWRPESVQPRDESVVAEFTNDHAGFYIVTREQLRRAITSGGFLKAPYDGRYGLPETAATDIYTSCGFRKVICISEFENFLIRHMSNLYVNRHGVPLPEFKRQIGALIEIREGRHPASTLCQIESKMLHLAWSKRFYERPSAKLLNMVSETAQTVLSIGCGSGLTEAKLQDQGAIVTAFPLDSVVGAIAAGTGVEMVYGPLEECLLRLSGRQFDCVLISNLLHLLPDPWSMLKKCASLLAKDGNLVIAGVHLNSVPILIRRALGTGDYRKLASFAQSGIHVFGVNSLKARLKQMGLRPMSLAWVHSTDGRKFAKLRRLSGPLMAEQWIVSALRRK